MIRELVDRAVETVAPRLGVKRAHARTQLRAYNALKERIAKSEKRKLEKAAIHEGAKSDRIRQGWIAKGGSADADVVADLPTLRQRSRELVRDEAHASGILQTLADNIAGAGFIPRATPRADRLGVSQRVVDAFAEAMADVYERWQTEARCDARERLSFGEMQHLAVYSTFENGDCFPHWTRVVNDPRRRYTLAVELLEGDRVDTPPDLMQDPRTRGGVSLGKRGQPLGFHVLKTHPGDPMRGTDDYQFVRAFGPDGRRRMGQLYYMTRTEQNRGVPVLAPVLLNEDDLRAYVESEVVSARIAACIAFVITKADPWATVQPITTNAASQKIEEFEPGMTEYLSPGEKVEMLDPKRPSQGFDEFVERMVRTIGRGIGIPYELAALDFSKTNYSSARAALLEVRRMFQCRQRMLVRGFCAPTWQLLVEEAWLRGDLPNVDLEANLGEWTRATWTPPGWGWVDPVKEIEASSRAIELNLSTGQIEAAAQGRDWRQTAIENLDNEVWLKEQREARGLGPAAPPSPAAPPAEDDEDQDDEERDEQERQAIVAKWRARRNGTKAGARR